MICLPFLSKRKKEKTFLALDVGTESVKTILFKRKDCKIIVLRNSLQYLNQFRIFDGQDLEINLIKNVISKTITDNQKETGIKINSVLLGLPANILKARIDFYSLTRKNPKEIISETERNIILQQTLNETKENISQKFKNESGILPKDIHFICLKIIETKIDGYKVQKLDGYKGKKLDFTILVTFLPKYYFENIEKTIKNLNLKNFEIVHPAQNLINIFEKTNAIFIDIGGELSQFFLVNKGKLENINDFDIGGKTFSRTLSEKLGLEEDGAKILKERYVKKELSEEVRKRIREFLFPEIKNWFYELKSKLENTKPVLPSNIFLFGGGSLIPEIEEILEGGDWGDIVFFLSPEIKLIMPKDLKNIEDKTKNLNSPQFIPTLLLCYHGQ